MVAELPCLNLEHIFLTRGSHSRAERERRQAASASLMKSSPSPTNSDCEVQLKCSSENELGDVMINEISDDSSSGCSSSEEGLPRKAS